MCDSCSRMEDVTWGLASSIEALVRVPSWNSRCSFSCVVISSYAPLEASTPHFLSFNVASSRRNAPIADGIAERDAKHDERRVTRRQTSDTNASRNMPLLRRGSNRRPWKRVGAETTTPPSLCDCGPTVKVCVLGG